MEGVVGDSLGSDDMVMGCGYDFVSVVGVDFWQATYQLQAKRSLAKERRWKEYPRVANSRSN